MSHSLHALEVELAARDLALGRAMAELFEKALRRRDPSARVHGAFVLGAPAHLLILVEGPRWAVLASAGAAQLGFARISVASPLAHAPGQGPFSGRTDGAGAPAA